MVSYQGERVRLYGSLNNGDNRQFAGFNNASGNNTDYAITGRGSVLVAGDWDQTKDASSWTGEATAGALGGAIHWQEGTTGTAGPNNDLFLWTLDGTFESAGFGSTAALYGRHTDNEFANDTDNYGAYVEGGYMVVPDTVEPFFRYQWIRTDDSINAVQNGNVEEDTNILTAGVNWYQARQNSKFTLDVVYALDPLAPGLAGSGAVGGPGGATSTGLGLLNDAAGEDEQVAVRAQYQLKW
jgi:hypothetical protein